ncbi:hypothetical protein U3516DRAFT_661474 [Neocallimastix sp. 'constans']
MKFSTVLALFIGTATAAKVCPGEGEYSCCSNCDYRLEDEYGQWGFENGKWCSVTFECSGKPANNVKMPQCAKAYMPCGGSEGGECAKAYYPCGGKRFPEITNHCCEKGSTCVEHNEFYFQCVPDSEL